MGRKYRLHVFVIMICAMLAASVQPAVRAEAAVSYVQVQSSSWLTGNNTDIYGSDSGETIKEEKEENSDPSLPEKMCMWIVNSVAKPLDSFFSTLGLTLNNVVLGRVGGNGINLNGQRVGLFTFEFANGNFYGIVGMAIYGVLRRVMYILVGVFVTVKLAEASMHGNSTKTYASLKSGITDGAVVIALLSIMPNILEMLLYVRDGFLYLVSVSCAQQLFPGMSGMETVSTYFSQNCESSLFHACLYLGSLVLTVWYALQYAGIALSFVVHMISFPFVAGYSFFDKNILNGWTKEVISTAMISVVDSALLLIPAFVGYFGEQIGNAPFAFSLLQFFICTMLIPARATFRKDLGLSPSIGMEMAGLMALSGAINMGGAAVRGLAGSAGKIGSGIAGYRENMREAERYDVLDYRENSIKNEYSDMVNHAGGYATTEYGDWTATGVYGTQEAYGMSPGSVTGERMDGVSVDGIGGASRGGGAGGHGMFGQDGTFDSKGNFQGIRHPSVANYQTDLKDKMTEINDRFATVSDLDSANANNISNARKAELYRKRAKQELFRGVASGAGGLAGTVYGGAMGFGAGTFFSPGATAMMTAGGVLAGGALASGLGLAAGAGTRIVGDALGNRYSQLRTKEGIIDMAPWNISMAEPEKYAGTVDFDDLPAARESASMVGMTEAEWQQFTEEQKEAFAEYAGNNAEYFADSYTDILNYANMDKDGKFENPEVADAVSEVCEGVKDGALQVPNGKTEKEAVIDYASQNIANLYQEKFDSNAVNMFSTGNADRDKQFNEIMVDKYKQTMLGEHREVVFSDENFEKLGYKFNADGSFVRE